MAEKDILREYLVKLGFQMDQASAKKFTDFMAGAEKAMVRFMVGIQAAAVAVTAGVSKFASQMERLYWAARHGGSSAGGLRSFEKTAQNLGASVESARSAVIGLASSMRANPVLEAYFKQFGIRTRDANGKLRDTTDLLRDLAPVLREMDFMTAKIYAQQLGISEDLLLAMRDPAFEVMYDNMKKNSAATDKAAEAAARFMQTLRDLEEKIFNVGVVIGEKLINLLGPRMDATAKWFEKNGDAIARTISRFAEMVVKAGDIILPIIDKIIYGWEKIFELGRDISNMIPADVGDKIGGGISRSLEWLGVKDAVDDLLGLTSKAPAGGSKTLDPMAFFQSMGWSKEQAAGIVANLQRESNMNPRAVGDNGKAVGIAQWHPDRQANYRKWSGAMFKDLKDATVEEQMLFVHYELTQGSEQKAGAMLRAQKNAEQAGRVVSMHYERPANAEYEASRRGAAAAQIAQTTTIQVIGAGDPVATANRVADAQSRVNQDMVRNFTPALN